MVKKAIFLIVVIVLLLAINNLVRSIYDIWNKQDLLSQAQKELTKEESRNQKLKAELSYVQTQKFIEEEARNKLFLVKPGEQQVLIPNTASESSKKQEKQTPNWQKWLQLFF
ncbi:MAG: septum formation initiator family protein [Patescibacteria group bacterium]|nr:septum formation initiator family protein [Patescibacteria group bacterium]